MVNHHARMPIMDFCITRAHNNFLAGGRN